MQGAAQSAAPHRAAAAAASSKATKTGDPPAASIGRRVGGAGQPPVSRVTAVTGARGYSWSRSSAALPPSAGIATRPERQRPTSELGDLSQCQGRQGDNPSWNISGLGSLLGSVSSCAD